MIINYPSPSFRIKREQGKDMLFDPLRKKWVVLTPEEWVRQNFVQFLVQEKKYPVSLIAIEKEIRLGELKKRFDILVYDTAHQPWMIVECKAPEINLSEEVLQQALRYNISVPVNYLLITNGPVCMGWSRGDGGLTVLEEMPAHT